MHGLKPDALEDHSFQEAITSIPMCELHLLHIQPLVNRKILAQKVDVSEKSVPVKEAPTSSVVEILVLEDRLPTNPLLFFVL